ncbi:NAD dependent epimerase/dehydratase family [Synechococcus sp. PCC 7335]|uniref:NAD-dependent epimerase n=1 Tax=Synechococcus sp. (strain ATCC 29403 / PCC 7335) TaxID=91464 RepID=UPI00017EC3C5|nr:NAD-dependent epimerase [Synechococcus sp. PCC 7335]EDX86474.1 NAD dependent epimerase/dehydratase family [Synechococcus sp. PCC 7335]
MAILVTGAAGFIGFYLSLRLLEAGKSVYGIDVMNDYYDVSLKEGRLAQLKPFSNFSFGQIDISDRTAMSDLFGQHSFECVVHLAAQAGVRYSLQNPLAYADSNLLGFVNILEGCRQSKVGHLVFASSSSVYGKNKKVPFATDDRVDHPVSLYAATKKSNELMAHAYSHLYGLPMTGLRFFTVYGPWGRPDMAYFKFVDAIAKGNSIDVYNHGKMKRDFTYIDDVVEGIIRVMNRPPTPLSKAEAAAENKDTNAPYKIYNIGNHSPVTLMDFITTIEVAMGKKAEKIMLPMQPGDVPVTYADVQDLMDDVGFKPSTPLSVGIQKFVDWYREQYGVS